MRKNHLSIIIFIIMCFLLSACQPTPEKEAVAAKNESFSEAFHALPEPSAAAKPADEQQGDGGSNSALYAKLGAPEHWGYKEAALDGKLNIAADVPIELPNVSQLPVASASLREFTQEDLNKAAEAFGIPQDAIWREAGVFTKEKIEQTILEFKEIISGINPYDFDMDIDAGMVERIKEDIAYYESIYPDAPSENELKAIPFQIDALENDGTGFEGTTQVNGQPIFFMAARAYEFDGVNRIYANLGANYVAYAKAFVNAPTGVELTQEQAAQQANAIAAQLTDELSLCHIAPVTTGPQEDAASHDWGWACVFMREINGCPTAYETTELSASLEAVQVPITYEKMIIVLDDTGLISFTWDIPMTVNAIENPDAALLSFPEISQRAAEQISQRFTDEVTENVVDGIDWSDPGCTANIEAVKLGLMRVPKMNSTEYYYLPVWKFFIGIEHTEEYYTKTGMQPPSDEDAIGPDGYPSQLNFEYLTGLDLEVVTLNALDGSVIDSNLGY